jgi:hypothetical protein
MIWDRITHKRHYSEPLNYILKLRPIKISKEMSKRIALDYKDIAIESVQRKKLVIRTLDNRWYDIEINNRSDIVTQKPKKIKNLDII